MKRFIRDYFSFNKRERSGFLVLLGIIAILLTYLYYLSVSSSDVAFDTTSFEKEVQEFELAQKNAASSDTDAYVQHIAELERDRKDITGINLFEFDPNNLSEEQWVSLGLSRKQAASVKKYEAAGGTFCSKEDVKNLRCISPSQYVAMEPYILIPEQKKGLHENKVIRYEEKPVELNSASRFELLHIALIDSGLAEQIIKFRNNLGGFFSKEQLKEIQSFDTTLYDKISAGLILNASRLRQMDVNLAGITQLSKHPYISFNVAKALVLYRETHGNFKILTDIKKCALINEELYRKVAPYLVVE